MWHHHRVTSLTPIRVHGDEPLGQTDWTITDNLICFASGRSPRWCPPPPLSSPTEFSFPGGVSKLSAVCLSHVAPLVNLPIMPLSSRPDLSFVKTVFSFDLLPSGLVDSFGLCTKVLRYLHSYRLLLLQYNGRTHRPLEFFLAPKIKNSIHLLLCWSAAEISNKNISKPFWKKQTIWVPWLRKCIGSRNYFKVVS